MSRPPTQFTSMRQLIYDTSCPRSQVKSTCVTAKFRSFFDHAETDEKRQNVISSSILRQMLFIFAVHVSFIISLQGLIILTKQMQKCVTTVCSHCNFVIIEKITYRSTGDQCSCYKLATLGPSVWVYIEVNILFHSVVNFSSQIEHVIWQTFLMSIPRSVCLMKKIDKLMMFFTNFVIVQAYIKMIINFIVPITFY